MLMYTTGKYISCTLTNWVDIKEAHRCAQNRVEHAIMQCLSRTHQYVEHDQTPHETKQQCSTRQTWKHIQMDKGKLNIHSLKNTEPFLQTHIICVKSTLNFKREAQIFLGIIILICIENKPYVIKARCVRNDLFGYILRHEECNIQQHTI